MNEKQAKNKKIIGQALSAVGGFLLTGKLSAAAADTDPTPVNVKNLSDPDQREKTESEKGEKKNLLFWLLGGGIAIYFLTSKK
jgi:hypothetical protein